MHNSIMEGLKRISTKSTPTCKNRNGIAARSTTSPVYNSTAADTKDYQMRDEPGRTYNGDWLKPKDNQMPPQAFLKQDYYPNMTNEYVDNEVGQKAAAQL